MTIQTYPMNFANLDCPQPPRDSVLVDLADVRRLLEAYRNSHRFLGCSENSGEPNTLFVAGASYPIYDNRCPVCKEYDSINAPARAAEEKL